MVVHLVKPKTPVFHVQAFGLFWGRLCTILGPWPLDDESLGIQFCAKSGLFPLWFLGYLVKLELQIRMW